jgi:hypothetical protein
MRRHTQKRRKSYLKKYTAFVPKTVKATKAVGSSIIKKINYIFNSGFKTLKKTTKYMDKTTAKSIRSLTKRKHRN